MDALQNVVREHWGYPSLRPLQHEAMLAAASGCDSLVVLPTGGGKSLCYQAPALLADRPTVVVSPLIALMKDQVDRLIERGIPSAFLNSSLDAGDRRRVAAGIMEGHYKLIFVAPERFASDYFFQMLGDAGVGAFAIDEAHCISHWGHDFRADYRRLGQLKKRFPDVPVHAFTATATPRVRDDIITQLGLVDPDVLVGDFFRPNLMYQVRRRSRGFIDVINAVLKRPGQAGIVYCIRRADVDELSVLLKDTGVKAIGYHAGMTDDERTRAQDAFAAGRAHVVVATVAFGMGIDRPDIRFVIHAAMPKTIEHYQQETGRAGRDNLPAECILFYSPGDRHLWQRIMEKNDAANLQDQLRMLDEMYSFCTGATCRHRKLVSYFGQQWNHEVCSACDVCTGTLAVLPDSTIVAQKIMSCVARVDQRHGPGYVADVLRGIPAEWIVQRGHDKLSTFGLVPDQPKATLMAWIDQLVDQGMMQREGEYRTLSLTPKGWQVLHSKAEATLYDLGTGRPARRERIRKRDRAEKTTKRAQGASPRPAAQNAASRTQSPGSPAQNTGVPAKSPEGATDGSPGRKPWVVGVNRHKAAEGRENYHTPHPTGEHHIPPIPPSASRTAGIQPIALHPARILPPTSARKNNDPLDAQAQALFEKLRLVRRRVADDQNVPAFVVFSDKTLREMARARPTNQTEMLAVHGIGPAKWQTYGQQFLDAITTHIAPSRRAPF